MSNQPADGKQVSQLVSRLMGCMTTSDGRMAASAIRTLALQFVMLGATSPEHAKMLLANLFIDAHQEIDANFEMVAQSRDKAMAEVAAGAAEVN